MGIPENDCWCLAGYVVTCPDTIITTLLHMIESKKLAHIWNGHKHVWNTFLDGMNHTNRSKIGAVLFLKKLYINKYFLYMKLLPSYRTTSVLQQYHSKKLGNKSIWPGLRLIDLKNLSQLKSVDVVAIILCKRYLHEK